MDYSHINFEENTSKCIVSVVLGGCLSPSGARFFVIAKLSSGPLFMLDRQLEG